MNNNIYIAIQQKIENKDQIGKEEKTKPSYPSMDSIKTW